MAEIFQIPFKPRGLRIEFPNIKFESEDQRAEFWSLIDSLPGIGHIYYDEDEEDG